MKLPEKGMSRTDITNQLDNFKIDDLDWESGKVFGYVFDPGKEAMAVGKEAYMKFLTENALDFTSFPSLYKFEKMFNALPASFRERLLVEYTNSIF